MLIDLHYQAEQKGPINPWLRAKEELLNLGIELKDKGQQAPVPKRGVFLAIQQKLVTPDILGGPSPIILLERADAAISWARRETKHQNVKRVFKIGILDPPHLNNFCRGRYHAVLLDPKIKEEATEFLEDSQIAKIKPGPNYAAYSIMSDWIEKRVDFEAERPYTSHFMGTTVYGCRDEITKHRKTALDKMQRLSGRSIIYDGRGVPRDTYNNTLMQSKVCISPWGYGEIAYRDAEALYAGTVLVKPDTSFVKTWPPLFVNGITYVPCKPDWSNLNLVVEEVLDNWDRYLEMRVNNRGTLVDNWSGIEIAKYLASMLVDLE